jgi:hypothetical protein
MGKKIIDIPIWAVFFSCFPEREDMLIEEDISAITNDQWLAIARDWRTRLLFESDWSQISDNSLTEIQREQWRQYRQELRDITDSVSNPKNIVFPDMPSK